MLTSPDMIQGNGTNPMLTNTMYATMDRTGARLAVAAGAGTAWTATLPAVAGAPASRTEEARQSRDAQVPTAETTASGRRPYRFVRPHASTDTASRMTSKAMVQWYSLRSGPTRLSSVTE